MSVLMAPPMLAITASATLPSPPLASSSSAASSRVLTREDVLRLTKRPTLQEIRHLNAWGMQLHDVSVLSELVSVEVLSLSVNTICSLESFRHVHHLRELYLRRNALADLSQLVYLATLPDLRVLWLADNPIYSLSNYRLAVIAFLPKLRQLDNIDVTPQEVERARAVLRADDDPAIKAAMHKALSLVPSWSPPPELTTSHPTPPPSSFDNDSSSSSKKSLVSVKPPPEARTTQTSPLSRTSPEGTASVNDSKRQQSALALPPPPPPPPPPPHFPTKRGPLGRPNVLSAVLLLLEELDPSSLKLVAQRCQDMIMLQEGGGPQAEA